MGVKVMTEEYTKNVRIKSKDQRKDKCHKKNSYIFQQNNDCETPYIDVYIELLLINFNLLSYFSVMFTSRSVILKSVLH